METLQHQSELLKSSVEKENKFEEWVGNSKINLIQKEKIFIMKELAVRSNLFKIKQEKLFRRLKEIKRAARKDKEFKSSSESDAHLLMTASNDSGDSFSSLDVTRPRAATVSFPIQMSRVELPATRYGMQPLAAFSPSRPHEDTQFPELNQNADDDIENDEIPQSVLDRGRRMSRSVSSLKELIKEEISDFVDKRQLDLPDLNPRAKPPLFKLNTAGKLTRTRPEFKIDAALPPSSKPHDPITVPKVMRSTDTSPDIVPQPPRHTPKPPSKEHKTSTSLRRIKLASPRS